MKSFFIIIITALILIGCQSGFEMIKRYDLSNESIVDKHLLINPTSDEDNFLKIATDSTSIIQLYETGKMDVDNCFIRCKAKVKAENYKGIGYLEMLFTIDGKEYYTRTLTQRFSGSEDWETPYADFILKKGEHPSNIKLNIIAEGRGTILVKSLELKKKPISDNGKDESYL